MNIETFYTGGGIWLAESVINEKGDYAVVSSEHYSKLGAELLALHLEMVLELKEEL